MELCKCENGRIASHAPRILASLVVSIIAYFHIFTFSQSAAQAAESYTLSSRTVEVVVEPKAPEVTMFAAEEMTNFLSQVLGAAVPLVTAPTTDKVAIVIGTNGWSAAAGVEPSKLKRDGFVIKCDPAANRIYVAGCDDPKYALRHVVARQPPDPWGTTAYERASVFAVYDFLERYAGVRFYFPGEIGTIVPVRDKIEVPAGEIDNEPDWRCRIIFMHQPGQWPEDISQKDMNRLMRLEQLRLRHQTESFNSCHGQYWMNLAKRFRETHPEYFALRKDGTRYDNPAGNTPHLKSQHLCQSSKVWDEMYEDAKSYFLGEPPEKRGVLRGFDDKVKVDWGGYCRYRKYYDVMPNDGHPECQCPECQSWYANAPDQTCRMSELVWSQTARLADRLKADGIPGTILQAAYTYYRAIPSVEIPDNVIVNLCLAGPYAAGNREDLQKEFDEVRAWSKKAGGRLWMWTYPGKHRCFNLVMDDVPNIAPRAMAMYMQKVAPHVLGVFPQICSDRFIYQYLDLYIYSRIAWDNGCDAGAILAEHNRLMFGDGAEAMGRLFDAFEDNWIGRIVGRFTPSPLGFTADTPDEYRLYTEIYAPEEIARLESFAAEALAAVPKGSMEEKRIKYIADRMLEPLARRVREYPRKIDPKEELKWRKEHPGELLLKNGSFETLEGWSNYSQKGTIGIDTNVFFSAPSSLRIVSTNDSRRVQGVDSFCRVAAVQGVKLKPGTTYRLSGFLKLENVKAVEREGGADFLVAAVNRAYPIGKDPCGTRDWHRFAYEFTTPAALDGTKATHIGPRLIYASGTAWIDDIRLDEVGDLPAECESIRAVAGHAPSLLPKDKKFTLVWHDEFDGDRLDESKWSYRTNFWGRRAYWFAAPEDNAVEVKDGLCRLKLVKKPDGQFVSPQLQTGELIWDIPSEKNPKGFWPFPKRAKPKFMHRYGYYECRCRLQRMPGWWSAFWMQAPMQGCSLDPRRAGIEHDIMESFEPGRYIVHAFHYNGYGADYLRFNSHRAPYTPTPEGIDNKYIFKVSTDEFHVFGMLWEPDGYTFFVDGRQSGFKVGGAAGEAVSQTEEFILISTEAKNYRKNRMTGKAAPELEASAAAGDDFAVDYVRVYDICGKD